MDTRHGYKTRAMIRTLMCRVLLTVSSAVAMAPGARAAESAPVTSKRSTATLLTSTDSVTMGGRIRLALRLRLAEGWHTYWRNPGEAGVPIELTWSLPPGTTVGPTGWPAPDRMAEGQITTYGYTGEVILPVTVTTASDAIGLDGEVRANWLVCKDICVPEEAVFRVAVPAGPAVASAQADLFAAIDARAPRPSPWETTIAPDGTLFIKAPDLTRPALESAIFIPDETGMIVDSATQTLTRVAGGFTVGLTLARPHDPPRPLSGVLTIRDSAQGRSDLAITAIPGPAPAGPMALGWAPLEWAPLGWAFAAAFLGGLILNLMPCVFPILAMKIVGIASGVGRTHALSYTAGVIATFMGIGVALLAARATGSAAGWGFQFASPVFVTVMAWVLFGVGLNLSGVVQVGSRAAGAGASLAGRGGRAGGFFTGALAVLVATPCSAPFMGVAIAAGLAAPPPVTLLVFLLMGLGLASPYLVLSLVPSAGRMLPRPGPWMEVLRQGLAFPMYGAAVWLLWVISQEAGPGGVLTMGSGFVLLGFAAWAWTQKAKAAPRLGPIAACVALVITAALPWELSEPSRELPPGEIKAGEMKAGGMKAGGAEAFTPARLALSRQAGKPVFVNLTAAWCVTCLVNERVAIGTSAVQRAFADAGVVYLKGDWTRQNPEITAFLRAQGRDGVPLYLYYKAGAATPMMLPQILTEGAVLAAIGAPPG